MIETYKGRVYRILAVAEVCIGFTDEEIKGFIEANEKYQFQGKFIVSYS